MGNLNSVLDVAAKREHGFGGKGGVIKWSSIEHALGGIRPRLLFDAQWAKTHLHVGALAISNGGTRARNQNGLRNALVGFQDTWERDAQARAAAPLPFWEPEAKACSQCEPEGEPEPSLEPEPEVAELLAAQTLVEVEALGDAPSFANDDGAVVAPGRSSSSTHKYYCGRELGREAIPDSDGGCGPSNGPQCPSCKRFQASLPHHPTLIIRGASVAKANGTYLLTANTNGRRPVYQHESEAKFKIQWSTMSSVWMLDEVGGSAPYKISDRADAVFPADAPWQDYQARAGRRTAPRSVQRALF